MEHLALATTALPLAAFMLVASITPGPNNLLVASAGAHAGYRATLPHLLGIGVGHSVQVALCATGIGAVLVASPDLRNALKAVSAAYLIWLAIKLVRATTPAEGLPAKEGGPMSFIGAATFQWINPKAWMMALTASRRPATLTERSRFGRRSGLRNDHRGELSLRLRLGGIRFRHAPVPHPTAALASFQWRDGRITAIDRLVGRACMTDILQMRQTCSSTFMKPPSKGLGGASTVATPSATSIPGSLTAR